LFLVYLKLFWLMIDCLKWLDLRAINMITLNIQNIKKERLKTFFRRNLIQSFARLPKACVGSRTDLRSSVIS